MENVELDDEDVFNSGDTIHSIQMNQRTYLISALLDVSDHIQTE